MVQLLAILPVNTQKLAALSQVEESAGNPRSAVNPLGQVMIHVCPNLVA